MSKKVTRTEQLLLDLRRDMVITTPETIKDYKALLDRLVKAYKALEPFRDSFLTAEETLISIDGQIAQIEDYLDKHDK